MDLPSFVGTLYTALTSYELMKMEAEYRRRKMTPRTASKADSEWATVMSAAQMAFSAGGLRGTSERQLLGYAKVLTGDRKSLNAVVKVANSGAVVRSALALNSQTIATASIVPSTITVLDPGAIVTPVPDLCDQPFAEGTYTKHFSYSFEFKVTLTVWCPKWYDPFRTCDKTFTIFGASFSMGLNIGYQVDCCGAVAWGQAAAQACVTIIGFDLCADCTASIVAVAGIGRTPTSSGCTYGLGFEASLQCRVFGQTIFDASVTFPWTINGPCPPAGLCD